MDSYTWTHQCLSTDKDLQISVFVDIVNSLKELLGAMNDRDGWERERERESESFVQSDQFDDEDGAYIHTYIHT